MQYFFVNNYLKTVNTPIHSIPGTPRIAIVSAENKFTGTITSYPSRIICTMYNNAKEQANLNHSNAIFSKIIPNPIFFPIYINRQKISSVQTIPINR